MVLRSLVVGTLGLVVAASCAAGDEVIPMAEPTTTSLTTVATAEPPTTASSTMPLTTTTVLATTTTTPPDTTTTTLAPIEDVESGWFCRDLSSIGYDYQDAVKYWQREGSPLRMDADHNGTACETVYDHEEVLAFFGGSLPESVTFNAEEWVGRTVDVEIVGDDWTVRVEYDGATLEPPCVDGPFAVPLEGYPEASGWIVAAEAVDWWAPTTPAELMVWIVDGMEGQATILAALGLRLRPDRPLDYCWTDPPTQHVFVWAGPTHTWIVDEPPIYFQRVDRNSFKCSAG